MEFDKYIYNLILSFVIKSKSNKYKLVFHQSDYIHINDYILKNHKNANEAGAWERGLLKYFNDKFCVDWDWTERYTKTIDGVCYSKIFGREKEVA